MSPSIEKHFLFTSELWNYQWSLSIKMILCDIYLFFGKIVIVLIIIRLVFPESEMLNDSLKDLFQRLLAKVQISLQI